MDEPTSALSEREVEALFAVIRDVIARGVAVIYISHKMEEISVSRTWSQCLRDGRHVATQAIGELDQNRLGRLDGRAGSRRRTAGKFRRAGRGGAGNSRPQPAGARFTLRAFTLRRGRFWASPD